MNVVERRTRTEGKRSGSKGESRDVAKTSIQPATAPVRTAVYRPNGLPFAGARSHCPPSGKISFHAATVQHLVLIGKNSLVTAAPISAARISIFLALCRVVARALRGRYRSNQSPPPATCRRHAGHRYGDWAATPCSPMRFVLPWTGAN
jgi:hypothetical protein